MTTDPFTCLYTGPPDECWNCGGWTKAAGGPFAGDSRYCSEDCFADAQERARLSAAKMTCCPECGFDNQEHSTDCLEAAP